MVDDLGNKFIQDRFGNNVKVEEDEMGEFIFSKDG